MTKARLGLPDIGLEWMCKNGIEESVYDDEERRGPSSDSSHNAHPRATTNPGSPDVVKKRVRIE